MFSQPLRQTRQSDPCIDPRLQSVALMRNDCDLSDTDRAVVLMATMNLGIPGVGMIAIPNAPMNGRPNTGNRGGAGLRMLVAPVGQQTVSRRRRNGMLGETIRPVE